MFDCRTAIGTPDNTFAIKRSMTWNDLELSLSKKLCVHLIKICQAFYKYYLYPKRTWGKNSSFRISTMLKIDNTDGLSTFAFFVDSSSLARLLDLAKLDGWLETFKFLGMKRMTRIVLTTETDAAVMKVACCLKNITFWLQCCLVWWR